MNEVSGNVATTQNITGSITSTKSLSGEVSVTKWTSTVDLSNYYTKEEVDNKIPNLEEYALKSEIPNLEDYALKSDIPDVSTFQTEEQVTALIETAIGGIENGSY